MLLRRIRFQWRCPFLCTMGLLSDKSIAPIFSRQLFLLVVGMCIGWIVNVFFHPFIPVVLSGFGSDVIVISVVLVLTVLICIIRLLYRRNYRLTALAKKYEIEEEGLGRGPQNFKYAVLSTATKGFSSNGLLGSGGFGSVYKGSLVLKGNKEPTEIAVKRLSATSHQGAQEFLAEVKIIGQVQHRNLVRVLGWCCEKGELLLVYNFMPNGSVDKHLHKKCTTGELVLTWARRLRIVSGVATALVYLHEDWEQRVIHRDVKSSNVMLDHDFNARLGDFGLARLSEHNQAPPSTLVMAGTYGYLAPELFKTLKPTEKSDVYSFGALVLEVATGKKPLLSPRDEESVNETFLVDWVWGLYENNSLLDAVDCRLHNAYDPGEMTIFLKIGLLCCHPNPDERPRMRDVINIWKGSSPFPTLPLSKPVPVFAESTRLSVGDTDHALHLDKHIQDGDRAANYAQVDVSTTPTSAMDSAGHTAVTVFLGDDAASPLEEDHVGQNVDSPNPSLLHNPPKSLPF